jgi:hypothetical protein
MHFVEKKLNVNRISLTIVYQLTPVWYAELNDIKKNIIIPKTNIILFEK